VKNPFKNAIAVERDNLRKSNKNYPKDRMMRLPLTEEQMTGSDGNKRIGAWRSFYFVAQLFETRHGVMRLSVNRAEIDRAGQWIDGITWDDLQMVKNQCGFADCDGLEVYPKEKHFVNDANMRHIFLFPPDVDVHFAWRVKEEQPNEHTSNGDGSGGGSAEKDVESPERNDPDQPAGIAGGAGQSGQASAIVPMPTSANEIRSVPPLHG
jgi:hypothetical protein